MPEGDTILRSARTLSRALAGKRVVRCASPLESVAGAGLEGHVVEAVEAHGKNLLMRFDDGRVLHTHMKMRGAWYLFRPERAPGRFDGDARVVLTMADCVAVCFRAPVVRVLAGAAVARAPEIAGLGPDVLGDTFDVAEARRRLRLRPALPIGEAILAQSSIAGIGNIYRSETLFLRHQDPFARVQDLPDDALDGILLEARRLMRANLTGLRRTRSALRGPRHWVYGRVNEACLACGSRVLCKRTGSPPRATYYCPTCQPPG